MSKTIRFKIKVDPFKLEQGHANWKMRKMGVMLTHKGRKVSRSVRNRSSQEEQCQND